MKYIDSEKLKAEIERKRADTKLYDMYGGDAPIYDELLSIIGSLQQQPRFPQYDNIVDKVFGAGNLEGWEYDEAEMLVALAKEELMKSLQQEQPQVADASKMEQPMPDSTQLIEFWHEDKEMLKEKDFRGDAWRLAYNAFMRGFSRGLAIKRQEQPEVDLEKEAVSFCFDNGINLSPRQAKNIASHFYKLGLNARKEE